MSPTGVQGQMNLTVAVTEQVDDSFEVGGEDPGTVVYKANIKWDSPVSRSRNVFNVSRASYNTPKLRFSCRNDFNKRGGALGNVDCIIEGTFKEKKVVVPPPV